MTVNFVLDYVRDIESLTPQRVTRHHHEDGIFRFGKQDAVQGKQAIEEALAAFFDNIKRMDHKEYEIWSEQNSAVFHANVSFTPIDGSRSVIPMVIIMQKSGKKVSKLQIIMDKAPLKKNHPSVHAKTSSYGILDYMAAKCRIKK